jgi:hypothetical protein
MHKSKFDSLPSCILAQKFGTNIRGAENGGFINCRAPQTFLHGFVIK